MVLIFRDRAEAQSAWEFFQKKLPEQIEKYESLQCAVHLLGITVVGDIVEKSRVPVQMQLGIFKLKENNGDSKSAGKAHYQQLTVQKLNKSRGNPHSHPGNHRSALSVMNPLSLRNQRRQTEKAGSGIRKAVSGGLFYHNVLSLHGYSFGGADCAPCPDSVVFNRICMQNLSCQPGAGRPAIPIQVITALRCLS